jgi:CheY-like chemotaxis protein
MKSKIPIIALTADVTTTDLEKCTSVGMNDYVPKPIDEKKLYKKIVALVLKHKVPTGNKEARPVKLRYTDLTYLNKRTKSKPALMMEMISVFLEQTPPLISEMSSSLREKDWNSLYSAVHKIIPSLSIMGINPRYETLARKIQEYSRTQQNTQEIPDMFLQLEKISFQACKELQAEYDIIKMTTNER